MNRYGESKQGKSRGESERIVPLKTSREKRRPNKGGKKKKKSIDRCRNAQESSHRCPRKDEGNSKKTLKLEGRKKKKKRREPTWKKSNMGTGERRNPKKGGNTGLTDKGRVTLDQLGRRRPMTGGGGFALYMNLPTNGETSERRPVKKGKDCRRNGPECKGKTAKQKERTSKKQKRTQEEKGKRNRRR